MHNSVPDQGCTVRGLGTSSWSTGDPIRLSPAFPFRSEEVVRAAREQELEGVVAKRFDSRYEPGQRSGAWVKYRTVKGQKLVIGGYLPGHNGFDSLLVGYYEGQRLIFVAKVRNGFTPALKREIKRRMKPLETARFPFANLPEPKGARRGEALTAEVMKKCRWLQPKLVAQIGFTDWARDNHLRHSRFLRLRDDKLARDVTRELPLM